GASLALIARDAAALEAARAEMESVGARAIAIAADVSDAEAVFAAADAIEERLGPIDIWVNGAMVTVFGPVAATTPEEFRRVSEVAYLGVVHGTMAALAHMRPRGRGVIVQVGSSLAYRSMPLQAACCGAEHAIRGFTDALRSELLHEQSRVKIVMVQLPAVNTPRFDWARTHLDREPRPVPPLVQPEVAADAVFRAARRPQRELWVGLSTLRAILSSMIAPAFVERRLARTAYRRQSTDRAVSPGRRDNLMRPVSALHRTRGAFSAEAAHSALLVSGASARMGIAVIGLVLMAAAVYGLHLGLNELARPAPPP